MTDEILHLLSERNRYLLQFASINRVQINRIKNGNYEQLNEFYMTREHILAVVEKIELLINQKSQSMADSVADDERDSVGKLLSEKDKLIKEILEQDLEILSSIELEKTNIITELKTLKKGKKTINAYKANVSLPKIDEEL